jgi:ankyrin repeat protein
VTRRSLPVRALSERPDLDQLKRQAKELLRAVRAGEPHAIAEVATHYHDPNRSTFALHDAQLVIARAYGFESWPKLKAAVEGATVRRLVEAVRADNVDDVRALLKLRPGLARMSIDNLQVLHHAVLARSAEMVRILMEHGADARSGVYPHRDATSAHGIAVDRGYEEIVRIIEAAEQKARDATSGLANAPAADDLFHAIASADTDRAIALMEDDPRRVHTRHIPSGDSPLHAAAQALDAKLVAWILDHGGDPGIRARHEFTALDAAAHRWYRADRKRFETVATLLLGRGAPMTAAAAAALGETAGLRARHAEGTLTDQNDGSGGLLRIAVTHDRPEVLELLLDSGFDPDERVRVDDDDDAPFTWGMALQQAVTLGREDMAEMLLKRGADPNASIHASGDPMFSAYSEGNGKMIALLERYGGVPAATTAGLFRQTELAKKMLAGEARFRVDSAAGATVGEQLLWGERLRRRSGDCPARSRACGLGARRPAMVHDARAAASYVETWVDQRSVGQERLSRLLHAHPGALRSECSRTPNRPRPVRLDDASQHRRQGKHGVAGAGRLCDGDPRSRRAARHSGQPPEEHAARVGMPMGPAAAR